MVSEYLALTQKISVFRLLFLKMTFEDYYMCKADPHPSQQIVKGGGKLLGEAYTEGEHGRVQVFEDCEGNKMAMYMGLK